MDTKPAGSRRTVTAVIILYWFSLYVFIPQQTPYLTGLGVSVGFVGVIVGAYGLTQMLCRIPLGLSADRAGRQRLFIQLGVALAGFACLLRVLFPGGVGYLWGNIVGGLSVSCWINLTLFYVGTYGPGGWQTGNSKAIMLANIGMLLAFVASTLLYSVGGMTLLNAMGAVAGAVALGFSCALREDVPEHPNTRPLRAYLCVFSDRKLIFFGLLAFVQQGVQISTVMSFTTQVLKNLGAGAVLIGFACMFYMLCAVGFAKLSSGVLLRAGGARLWVPVVLGLVGVYCLLVPRVGSVPAIFLLQILPGMSTGILYAYCTGEATGHVPAWCRSTAMGYFQSIYAVGITFLPILAGRLAQRYSMTTAYTVLAGTALAALVASLLIWPARKKYDVEVGE